MWAAVSVGKGNTKYTHANGLEKFTFRILPRAAESKGEKPRGFYEIQDTIKAKIRKGAFLIFDKWLSSVSAVKKLGYRHALPVNPTAGWRDSETGYHSNDIESENARVKGWARKVYGKLILTELDLFEYQWSVNTGGGFTELMNAFAFSNGGKLPCRKLVG